MSKYKCGLSKRRESIFSEHYLVNSIGTLFENKNLEQTQCNIGDTVNLSGIELEKLINIMKKASAEHIESTFNRIDARIEAKLKHAQDKAELAIFETVTDRQFMKGPRSNIELDDIVQRIERAAATNSDVRCVIVGLPFKMPSILKCPSGKADLSEVGFILQLEEFCQVLRRVILKWITSQWMGCVRFDVVCDGSRFNNIVGISEEEINEYKESTRMWLRRFNLENAISLYDYKELLSKNLSNDDMLMKEERREDVRRLYFDVLGTYITVDTLHRKLHEALINDPDHEYENVRGRFTNLFQSMLFTMRYRCIEGGNRRSTLYQLEYLRRMKDIMLLLKGAGFKKEIVCTRDELNMVLTEAWQATIAYIAEIRSDRDWNVDTIMLFFPDCLRWTIHSKSGQIGMNCTRSNGLSIWPWHGVSILKESDSKLKQYNLPISMIDKDKYFAITAEVCGSESLLIHIPHSADWKCKNKLFEELEMKYTRRVNG